MKFFTFFAFACLAVCAYSSPIEPELENTPVVIDSKQATVNYRLSTDVKPIHYDLMLTPYFVTEGSHQPFTFDGMVSIQLQATRAGVNQIQLHMNDLIITDWFLRDGTVSASDGVFVAADYEELTHKWTIPLNTGFVMDPTKVYTLTISYTGFLREDMNGFYRSYYYENGVKQWMATTQFQMTESRRAFPNFDEPSFKATFQLTMNRPQGINTATLSNTMLTSNPVINP